MPSSDQDQSTPKYRAVVIGLGWMGMLYDLAPRASDRFDVDDVDRPTPELDVHRRFHHHQHPGESGLPNSYAEAFTDRAEVELVAAADRDEKRLAVFTQRYGISRVYTDAELILRSESADLVAVATNTKTRADLTVLAAECGARGIVTEKPMVDACAQRRIHLSCGSISTTDPAAPAPGRCWRRVPRRSGVHRGGWCFRTTSELVVFPGCAPRLGRRNR